MSDTQTFYLNRPPVAVGTGDSGTSSKQTNSTTVLTLAPDNNMRTSVSITNGAQILEKEFSSGAPVPYPVILTTADSYVKVLNNTSLEGSNVMVGLYSYIDSSTKRFSKHPEKIGQYQSISGQTTSGFMSMVIEASSNSAVCAIVFVGDSEPIPVFLNTPKDNLPPEWKDLKNVVIEAGGSYKLSKNFYGQTIFVVNVSLTSDAEFTARLQG